jgi:hypothetical protein
MLTKSDYEMRYEANVRYEGYGLATTVAFPCPFCAEPGFSRALLLEVIEVVQREHVCRVCGRGAIALLVDVPGLKKFEFVQTRGDDPPPYVAMRRHELLATTDGKAPRPGYEGATAPAPVDPVTGQHEAYWVLSSAERARGFVRPVRMSYEHVGGVVCGKNLYPADERGFVRVCRQSAGHGGGCGDGELVSGVDYAKLLAMGRLGGCGAKTTMSRAIAETYARDPKFYSHTFCVRCARYLPVAEFVWTGTSEVVGL